jgi:hypothetical protein
LLVAGAWGMTSVSGERKGQEAGSRLRRFLGLRRVERPMAGAGHGRVERGEGAFDRLGGPSRAFAAAVPLCARSKGRYARAHGLVRAATEDPDR